MFGKAYKTIPRQACSLKHKAQLFQKNFYKIYSSQTAKTYSNYCSFDSKILTLYVKFI